MLFSLYPYHNFSDYNLDWVIHQIKKLASDLENFINFNAIKYADPIAWDITSQYEANTVIIDSQTGNAYISTRPVPVGVHITNTDYWTPIFNYEDSINTLREQIAAANQHDVNTAIEAYSEGGLLWWNGYLYRVLYDIAAGTRLIVNTNIEPVTIEEIINELATKEQNDINALREDMEEADTSLREDMEEADASLRADMVENDTLLKRKKVWNFKTVNEMCSFTELETDDICVTAGYYTENDGGGAHYIIGSFTSNGMDIVDCQNNLTAKMLDTDGNIKKYGCNNDSVNNYLTRALAANKKVYLPSGLYNLTANINIPDGSYICGDGMRTTLITTYGTEEFGFKVGNTTTITDIGFIHNASDTASDGVAIDVSSHSNIIRDVFIYNAHIAIRFTAESSNFVHNCIIEEFSQCGLFFTNCTDMSINGLIVKSTKANTHGTEFINYVEAIKIIDTSFLLMTTPVFCASADSTVHTTTAKYNFFSNCYFDSCSEPRLTNAQNFKFVECWFSNRPTSGFSIVGNSSRNIVFDACSFHNSQTSGLEVENAKNVIISNCDFVNNGRGLMIVGTCQYVTIDSNQFYNSDLPATTNFNQDWGLFINGSTHSKFIIVNNIAHDNTTGGFTSGTPTGTDFIVDNNIWS